MADLQPSRSSEKRWSLPFHITLEPWLAEPPRWYPMFTSFMAVVIALILGGVVIALAGGNPFASYAHIARA